MPKVPASRQPEVPADFLPDDFPADLDPGEDILRTIPVIAAFRNERPEQTKHAIRLGRIPTWNEGSTVCASKHVLRQMHIARAGGSVRKS